MEDAFLKSKLGQRFFILFLACAIVPVVLLGFITFFQVKQQIKSHGQRELYQSTKAIGMSIYERAILLDSEIKSIAETVDAETGVLPGNTHHTDLFESIFYYRSENLIIPLFVADPKKDPVLPAWKLLKPRGDSTRIYTQKDQPRNFRVFMSRQAPDRQRQEGGFLVGAVNTSFLWKIGSKNILPPQTELCVLTRAGEVIFSSLDRPQLVADKLPQEFRQGQQRMFRWSKQGDEHIAAYWPLFMKSSFASPNWIIILSKTKADMLAPLAGFQNTFLLVILLALLSVTLFSMVNIRRILVPLERIKNGIRKISNQNFKTRVEVTSNDEFMEVAQTFNAMSAHLDDQFRTIQNMAEIDKAILSSLEPDLIVRTVVQGVQELTASSVVAVTMMKRGETNLADAHYSLSPDGRVEHKRDIEFPWETLKNSISDNQPVSVDWQTSLPQCLVDELSDTLQACWILPIFIRRELTALVSLCYAQEPDAVGKDLERAQQLTNQMAVALANSNLIQDLDRLHWGTITALAKTVDAKSSWTAGHSERVCAYAIEIEARIMAVADAFDAMTSERSYRKGMTFLKAAACIAEGSGTQFDPEVVEAFLAMLNTLHAQELKAGTSPDKVAAVHA